MANRFSPSASQYLIEADAEAYQKALFAIRLSATIIHEVLGHGTGKLLKEGTEGSFNFDRESPPINPFTEQPITTWYLPGQTWLSVFEDIATTVEECRAILMSAYLIDDEAVLRALGYTDQTVLTANQLTYLSYLHLAVEGLRSLEHFNVEQQAWTQAHSQGYFAIFKYLLKEAYGLFTVVFDPEADFLVVRVNESKITSHGKPALGKLMYKLHVWRCTADVESCRPFYKALSAVDGVYENWRKFVSTKPAKRLKFVQANTIREGDQVELKVYEESDAGIIQSWADRAV